MLSDVVRPILPVLSGPIADAMLSGGMRGHLFPIDPGGRRSGGALGGD